MTKIENWKECKVQMIAYEAFLKHKRMLSVLLTKWDVWISDWHSETCRVRKHVARHVWIPSPSGDFLCCKVYNYFSLIDFIWWIWADKRQLVIGNSNCKYLTGKQSHITSSNQCEQWQKGNWKMKYCKNAHFYDE